MLSVVEVPVKRGRGRPPLTAEEKEARRRARVVPERVQPVLEDAPPEAPEAPGDAPQPVDEVRAAFARGKRLAGACGFLLGGFVPAASYTIVHLEVAQRPQLWVLVAGGLAYSALSVFTWARRAFRHPVKAAGFVILTEGTLTMSHTLWLSLAGLGILVVLNGATAAVLLQKKEEECY